MRIAPLRFQIRTILLAIAAMAGLLALGLELGTLSEEARRGRLQRQVEKNQRSSTRTNRPLTRIRSSRSLTATGKRWNALNKF